MVHDAAHGVDGLREIGEFSLVELLFQLAGRAPFTTHEIGRDQDVSRRIVLPVGHQIIDIPERKLVDLREGPSGSSGDVAVSKGPLRYTGTGVGSPAEAFLRPETSSTALNSALKSS